jgi:hypothetical protein
MLANAEAATSEARLDNKKGDTRASIMWLITTGRAITVFLATLFHLVNFMMNQLVVFSLDCITRVL